MSLSSACFILECRHRAHSTLTRSKVSANERASAEDLQRLPARMRVYLNLSINFGPFVRHTHSSMLSRENRANYRLDIICALAVVVLVVVCATRTRASVTQRNDSLSGQTAREGRGTHAGNEKIISCWLWWLCWCNTMNSSAAAASRPAEEEAEQCRRQLLITTISKAFDLSPFVGVSSTARVYVFC